MKKRIAVRRTVWTCPIKVEPYNFWVSFGILSCVELPSFTVESSRVSVPRRKKTGSCGFVLDDVV